MTIRQPTKRPLPPADPYPTRWDDEEEAVERKHPSDVRDVGPFTAFGRAVSEPVRAAAEGAAAAAPAPGVTTEQDLPLPHERDQGAPSQGGTAARPLDRRMEQARRDLENGQVDTDCRATPGLDAERRRRLVKQPGGR